MQGFARPSSLLSLLSRSGRKPTLFLLFVKEIALHIDIEKTKLAGVLRVQDDIFVSSREMQEDASSFPCIKF